MSKQLNCIALDDEPLALQVLETYIHKVPELRALGFYTDPDEARKQLVAGGSLLFLDIQMPDISGLEFIKTLPSIPDLVFTTAHAEFAVEGFNLDAIDYLLKPFDFQRFTKAVDKVLTYGKKSDQAAKVQEPEPMPALFVKSNYTMVKIPLEDIIYIESLDVYVKIYIKDRGKPVITKISLKNLLEKLPAGNFLQVHRSYIVALDKMLTLRRSTIDMVDKRQVLVGAKYAQALRAYFS